MKDTVRMVAVDIDGTFVRSDYTYDVPRFKRILSRMKSAGCQFVVASGNQYYQLRDLFPGDDEELSFVAENGAGAYCEYGTVSQEFFDLTGIYYHRLKWAEDLKKVKDQILKFAPTVPEEKTYVYYDMFCERLKGKAEPTTSGHGSIDLIVPGCHKASGLRRLAERRGITLEQCAAFGDGGNDIEMLKACGYSYAMDNAPRNVKNAAKSICPSNEEDGVLVTLEQLFA